MGDEKTIVGAMTKVEEGMLYNDDKTPRKETSKVPPRLMKPQGSYHTEHASKYKNFLSLKVIPTYNYVGGMFACLLTDVAFSVRWLG